ncbi:MAG: oligopeptide/dipeptide ABC transporter ATP-binding protein, partial [Gaiellales bacterium]
ADRVIVMYGGRVVEHGTKQAIFSDPQHPYTWGLLGSIPRLDRPRPKRLTAIPGQPPSLVRLPSGCAFHPRCPQRFDRCLTEVPELKPTAEPGHLDACHLDIAEKRSRRAATIDPSLVESA